MKIEFRNYAKGINWIRGNATSEKEFRNFREQLDIHHFFTGKFFLFFLNSVDNLNVVNSRIA